MIVIALTYGNCFCLHHTSLKHDYRIVSEHYRNVFMLRNSPTWLCPFFSLRVQHPSGNGNDGH